MKWVTRAHERVSGRPMGKGGLAGGPLPLGNFSLTSYLVAVDDRGHSSELPLGSGAPGVQGSGASGPSGVVTSSGAVTSPGAVASSSRGQTSGGTGYTASGSGMLVLQQHQVAKRSKCLTTLR